MTEFADIVADARTSVEQMRNDARRYTREVRDATDDRLIHSYLHRADVVAAQDRCMRSIEESATAFLEICDHLVVIQETLDQELHQVCGLEGGVTRARDLIYHANTSGDMLATIQAVTGQYANQVEGLRSHFDAALGTLESEHNRQLEQFRNSVAETHNVGVDVLDTAVNVAWMTGRVTIGLAGLTAVASVTAPAVVAYVSWVLVVGTPVLAIRAAGGAANAIWELFGV
ncbi:hypothetical protein [Streptomyces chartreusis]|uniref:hypothetical protein n=1 Tax=Streptomyces chartreusis TaxID=1969 RepID=UPI0033E2F6C1